MRKEKLLDEMQEQKMLKLESGGYKVAFAALVVVLLVQFALVSDLRQIAGELAVILALAIYIIPNGICAGLWERDIRPSLKSNLPISLGTAAGIALMMGLRSFLLHQDPLRAASFGTRIALIVFVLTLAALELARFFYNRQKKKLEHPPED